MAYDISGESPVQWLRLGESSGTTAVDASGNGHDGTYAGSGITKGQTGLVDDADTCVALSGGNNVNINAGNNVSSASAFSAEIWFTLDDSTLKSILIKGNDSLSSEASRDVEFYLLGTSELRILFSDGTTYRLILNTGQILSTGVVYHLVVTWDGTTSTNAVKVYLQGSLVAQGTPTAAPSNTHSWRIGGAGTNGFCLDGQADEFALYSDVLTPTEVQNHYDAGTGGGDSLTISTPADAKFYGIDLDGTFDIPIAGVAVGQDGEDVEANFNGGEYQTIATVAAGSWSGTLLAQAAGQGDINVRVVGNESVEDTATGISLGFVALVAGQSNGEGRGTNNQSYTHASLTAYMDRQSGGFAELADPTDSGGSAAGSAWPLLATLVMAENDIPILFITNAEGATGLVVDNDWTKNGTGGTGNGATYAGCITHVTNSAVNRIHAILWDQGQNDAFNEVSQEDYNAGLDGLIANFRGEGGALASAVLISIQLPNYATNADGVDAIRAAQAEAFDDNANIYPGPVLYDVDLADGGGDGVHFKTDAELTTLAQRWWAAWSAAMADQFSVSLFDGGGVSPKFVSATENATRDQVTVTFDQTLRTGTTLATDAWTVTDDGTPVTIDSASVSGATVVLTLNSALTGSATTVTLGTVNDSAGLVVPEGAAISLPTTGSVYLPARPLIGEDVDVYEPPPIEAGIGAFAPAFSG